MEDQYDIPLDQAVSNKIVNLNAITPRVPKFKSRNKGPDDQAHLPMVKMDHSNIYKENDILEEGLVEHIYNLNRDEKRQLAETGEQLEEIRKQVEVITKLQEAVNSRAPGESADLLANTRVIRHGSIGEDHKGNKSQQRIEAEREKYSAKNLFNVRRSKTVLGFETLPHPKKFFTPPIVESEITEEVADHVTVVSDDKSVFIPELKPPPRAKSAKGYLKPTSSSMSGLRPITADVGYTREVDPNDILPPRAKTAVIRSRSRRELEILSRVAPRDDEIIMTFENRRRNMEILGERRRKSHLLELRNQNMELQVKVHNFLRDLERFNKTRQTKTVVKRMEYPRILFP
ncbi:uncharacterized protein LOC129926946 [Biomphalaria glabrata]|uniref:Uncharacterized protein LOC129926946 n=1 Tax=Biomphalaria glabrata TaxID=6526 RepID=A0A9W3AQW9_BIOGL|nr:uncharacterized protein LOC129926946 [Biomphalaria glabrata]